MAKPVDVEIEDIVFYTKRSQIARDVTRSRRTAYSGLEDARIQVASPTHEIQGFSGWDGQRHLTIASFCLRWNGMA